MRPIIDPSGHDRPRILVGDDDRVVRSFLKRVLEREGFEVVPVANGREALEEIGRQEIDLVLLDIEMPIQDGLGALREIRGHDHHRTLPVILITGSDAEADRVRALETGADDFLVKPIAVNELAARVRAQLRVRQRWASELERTREKRRRLAAALDSLPRGVPLVMLATTLVDRLIDVLQLDGVAILHFANGRVRTVAASGSLKLRYPVNRPLDRATGRDIATRTEAGPWLEAARPASPADSSDVAYVPFRLGPTPKPIGCLCFALRPGAPSGPLAHRLADLIDAGDFIVAVLRPAIEEAETTNAAVTRVQRLIARREFTVHLQPIVRLDSGVVVGVEAFARFPSGIRPDAQFAEASTLGLGRALERAALSAAIEATAELPRNIALSVNLSGDAIQHEPALPKLIGGAGRDVIVELTEHERIDDYEALRAALGRLGPNVKLAVDDAGSGYSSLRHILALQPDYVKLDIEWVHDIDRDPVRRSLVTGLAYFARETGCELIAEGIETEAELSALRELSITLGQGYLLGRPEAPTERAPEAPAAAFPVRTAKPA